MAISTLAPLRKGTKVVAAEAMRDVPEGTPGKVTMVAGLTWIRYWVRFDNGVSLGSISRDQIATKEDLERGDEVVASDVADDAAAGSGGGDSGGGDAGGFVAPNGTVVPQKLIDRSKAARARLGA